MPPASWSKAARAVLGSKGYGGPHYSPQKVRRVDGVFSASALIPGCGTYIGFPFSSALSTSLMWSNHGRMALKCSFTRSTKLAACTSLSVNAW